MRTSSIISLSLLLAASACGDDTGGGGGSGSTEGAGGSDTAPIGTGGGGGEGHVGAELDVEACEHLAEGPFVEHTAGETAVAAPDVSAEHTAHTIALVDFAGQQGGHVSFQAPAAGDYVFFLDADVPLTVQSTSGTDVPIEASCNPAACSEICATIVGRHVVDLEVGTYVLAFGPTLLGSVGLVHEAAGAHADE